MGRHRKDERDKKISLNLSITKKYVEVLKKRNVNISKLVEDYLKKFLGM